MSFPADLLGGKLRQSPLPKNDPNNSTSAAQKQSKSKIATNCATFSNAGFFRPHISSSCFHQIIMQEKHSYAHGNPLRTSHIAICEVKGNKQKPIPCNRSTNPNESDTTHLTLSQFKASKVPLVPLVALVTSANGKVQSPNPSQTIAPKTVDLNSQLHP